MRFNRLSALLILFATIALVIIPSLLVAAVPVKVAVLYPPVANSFLTQIFDEIVDGIKLNREIEVVIYPVTGKENIESIKDKLKDDGIDTVIAIGDKNYPIGKKLAEAYPVVHGGVMIKPNGHSGISLVADPEQFFSHLKRLAPSVKRVYTVYSEASNGWLIRMAKKIAEQYDIELNAFEADTLREGSHNFRQLLGQVRDERDAVWLLLDKVVPDKAVLPVVLEKAWDSHVVVFSNNPTHVRRGALFSLFPDNYGTGESLGELVLRQRQPGAQPLVLPSKNLKISVNERTALHLGFSVIQSQRVDSELVYPVQ
ncbi:hypothetical protein MNBD_GAMMA18-579 [hydrothermal vent metagenome]|uniref:ABC transporter substrate-binding protein n=1 Tax=hydrothermal vent metagenome TaxID=652676 RepID=A0A3B0ZAG9_9ZZZZ